MPISEEREHGYWLANHGFLDSKVVHIHVQPTADITGTPSVQKQLNCKSGLHRIESNYEALIIV